MKARLHVETDRPVLSISLIVKNEQKFLRDCLVALQPLMREVSSELIIVDTGSTDNTVEIAKEFTDQVYYFEWCDDFSAARNYGLQHAQGEWFLYIDADEHFAQTKGISNFLNSPKRNNYDLAVYTLRNYFDEKRVGYADYPTRRLFKIYEGLQFISPIHEGIPPKEGDKIYSIDKDALAYHYGYSLELGTKYKEDKHKRNLKLLLSELEKDPDSTHIILHLVKEYISHSEMDKAIFYCLRGLEIDKKVPMANTRCFFYNRLLTCYMEQGKVNKVLEVAEQYFACEGGPYTTDLDIYYNRASLYIRLSEFEKAVVDCERYFERYRAYKNKKLLTADIYVDPILCSQQEYYYRCNSNYAFCLASLERYDEARKALDRIEIDKVDIQNGDLLYMQAEFTLIDKSKDYGRVASLYEKHKALKDQKKLDILQTYIENYTASYKDGREEISEILAKRFENLDETYIKLQKARVAFTNGEKATLQELVEDILSSQVDVIHSEILYFALKLNMSISLIAKAFDFTNIQTYTTKNWQRHNDFSEVACQYFEQNKEPDTAVEMSFCYAIKEQLLRDIEMDKEQQSKLFNSFVNDAMVYLYNVFSQDVLNEEDIKALPKQYRFAYYMAEAYRYRAENQIVDYVKSLKSALLNHELMKGPIELLVKEVEAQVKEQEKQAQAEKDEFHSYTVAVKAKVKELLKAKEYDAAKQILQSLEKLLPGDMEVQEYQKECAGK